jgi:hypothetical protein
MRPASSRYLVLKSRRTPSGNKLSLLMLRSLGGMRYLIVLGRTIDKGSILVRHSDLAKAERDYEHARPS